MALLKFLLLVCASLNQVVPFITTDPYDFVKHQNYSAGTAHINTDISLVPKVKDRSGVIVYPHSLNTFDFEVIVQISHTQTSKGHSTAYILFTETNSFASSSHNYKLLDGMYFNVNGVAIRIDIDTNTAYINNISHVHKSNDNVCKFNDQGTNVFKVIYKNNKFNWNINLNPCPILEYNLTEFEFMLKAQNKVEGQARINVTQIEFKNMDNSYTRQIEDYQVKKLIDSSEEFDEYIVSNESHPLDTDYYRSTLMKAKLKGITLIEYKTDPETGALLFIKLLDGNNKAFQCNQYHEHSRGIKTETVRLSKERIHYIVIFYTTEIEQIQISMDSNSKPTKITLGKVKSKNVKSKKITLGVLPNAIYQLKMFCSNRGITNMQIKWEYAQKSKSSDVIHNYLHRINKMFVDSSLNISEDYNKMTKGMSNTDIYAHLMAQNQILDEQSYINNHYIMQQHAAFKQMNKELDELRLYIGNLKRHHHSNVFERSDVLQLDDIDIESLYKEKYGNYEPFKEFMGHVIGKKYSEIENRLDKLHQETMGKIESLNKIQGYLNNYEEIHYQAVQDEISYLELFLIVLLVLSNLVLIYSYRLKEKNLF